MYNQNSSSKSVLEKESFSFSKSTGSISSLEPHNLEDTLCLENILNAAVVDVSIG